MLRSFEDVELVGEAENGAEAIELIERERPDMAFLDLQMPEVDGLGVVRLLRKNIMPLVAFVTAYDEYAVRAFEVNAVDYLLKPVDRKRLRQAIDRAQERLERADLKGRSTDQLRAAASDYEGLGQPQILKRIPVRNREEILLLPVKEIASVVAEGELLHITTIANDRYSINYRLKDLEARLDSSMFVRFSRGALANVEMIERVNPMPGGTYVVSLANGQELSVSRLQSRILRSRFFRI
jgi:DNA-binding LytR/AlgR family response regulator